ncbi:MAG: HU family DNA-binding protein [Firmicutes bacterium]|nr:HU family DNA-binding protein [Bacillota bacterium]
MTKKAFIKDLSIRTGLPKKETSHIVDELTDLVIETLRRGGEVGLGIGKFKLKQRSAREGVNPATGERIQIGPKVVPLFKPNKKFKSAVLE